MNQEIWNKLPKLTHGIEPRVSPELEIGNTCVVIVLPVYLSMTPNETDMLKFLEEVSLHCVVREPPADSVYREILVLDRADWTEDVLCEVCTIFGVPKLYPKVC